MSFTVNVFNLICFGILIIPVISEKNGSWKNGRTENPDEGSKIEFLKIFKGWVSCNGHSQHYGLISVNSSSNRGGSETFEQYDIGSTRREYHLSVMGTPYTTERIIVQHHCPMRKIVPKKCEDWLLVTVVEHYHETNDTEFTINFQLENMASQTESVCRGEYRKYYKDAQRLMEEQYYKFDTFQRNLSQSERIIRVFTLLAMSFWFMFCCRFY